MDEPAIPGGEPEPVLVMIDRDGQPRISITLTSGNPQIVLSRCKQRPGSESDHEPCVLLCDEDWQPLVEIGPEPPQR